MEATGRDHRHIDRVDHLWQQQRRGDRSRVPAPFAALCHYHVSAELRRLLGMPCRPHGRNAQHAGVLEPVDGFPVRSPTVARRPDAMADDRLDDLGSARLLHQEVHAERSIGELLQPPW